MVGRSIRRRIQTAPRTWDPQFARPVCASSGLGARICSPCVWPLIVTAAHSCITRGFDVLHRYVRHRRIHSHHTGVREGAPAELGSIILGCWPSWGAPAPQTPRTWRLRRQQGSPKWGGGGRRPPPPHFGRGGRRPPRPCWRRRRQVRGVWGAEPPSRRYGLAWCLLDQCFWNFAVLNVPSTNDHGVPLAPLGSNGQHFQDAFSGRLLRIQVRASYM